MSINIKLVIPFRPMSKKNGMQVRRFGGRYGIGQSNRYVQYEKQVLQWFESQPYTQLGIDQRINIQATYYIDSNRASDLTNYHASLHDLLVKAGLLEDDNHRIIAATDGSRVVVVNSKYNPHLIDKQNTIEIHITDFKE